MTFQSDFLIKTTLKHTAEESTQSTGRGNITMFFVVLARMKKQGVENTTTIVFIICITKQAKFHLSSTMIDRMCLFGYVVYSSASTHCQQSASAEEYIT